MAGARGIIVAVSANGVIGLHGDIPWRHAGDQKRFKEITAGATVVMGRHTWESLPRKPLPKRRNIVVTSRSYDAVVGGEHPDVLVVSSIDEALRRCAPSDDVWFIGGARIYAEAMAVCDVIDVTFVPDVIESPDAIRFPDIPETWECVEETAHEHNPRLTRAVYRRRIADEDAS